MVLAAIAHSHRMPSVGAVCDNNNPFAVEFDNNAANIGKVYGRIDGTFAPYARYDGSETRRNINPEDSGNEHAKSTDIVHQVFIRNNILTVGMTPGGLYLPAVILGNAIHTAQTVYLGEHVSEARTFR
ncbi:DNA helicase [Prevotella sp. MGM1]|nr:DNA helicase [Prevotella sp. MGM1]